MKLGIGIPVLSNFEGCVKLLRSIQGTQISTYIQDNWNNNLGVAASWNMFINQAIEDNIDLLFIVNDDALFEPGSFWKAVNAWASRKPEDCILMTCHCSHAEDQFYPDMADFCCFAFNPRQLKAEIGLFDENFYPAYFEDNDMMHRIKISSFKYYLYGGLKCWHEGSKTQFWAGRDNPVVDSPAFEKNRDYFNAKWGNGEFTKPFNGEQ